MWKKCFFLFVLIASGIVLLGALAYANNQQVIRLGANEPQEWLAQDAAARIESGNALAQVATGTQVAIESDPAPYIIVYDSQGKPLAGTGFLHGTLPTLPNGVLSSALQTGRNFITWQPERDVREAIVMIPLHTAAGGFVVAGRSLAYSEWEQERLIERTSLGMLVVLAGLFAMCLIAAYFSKPK
jgi:hypothetical protein